MAHREHYTCWSLIVSLCQWAILLFTFKSTHSQIIFTATIVLSNPGTQYIPVNMPAQLISTTISDSIKSCTMLCTNNVLCRVYDYEATMSQQCRLFEGDADTLGQIVSSSSSPQSNVGTVQLSADLFSEYGKACVSACQHSRYLQCGNSSTCQCMPHTYWNPSVSMCVPQSPILGASCQQNMSMCRGDLNYTCLQFNQCGPLSVLSGTTLANSSSTISGGSPNGLSGPYGVAVFGTNIDSLAIVDSSNNRIVVVWDASTTYKNISVIASQWAPGQPLSLPYDVYVDSRNGSNLYVTDTWDHQVVRYSNMQSVSPLPLIVAGTAQTDAAGYQYLNYPFGIAVDSHSNVIVASANAHRIMFWPPNATNGTLIAGLGVGDSTSMGLRSPAGIVYDEQNSLLYVTDSGNHRIQRYSLNGSWPCNGTTVAGGNGAGVRSDQLWFPKDVWLSKKTGALYIADFAARRIQRWNPGASKGVTMAGDPNGNAGINSTMLNGPMSVALNANETYMYVVDCYNNRVQRFEHI